MGGIVLTIIFHSSLDYSQQFGEFKVGSRC